MFTKKAEERIKQLCCLGLGGEVIMPTLLKELHAVVHTYANHFVWSDQYYNITNFCFEDPINVDIAPLYFSEFYKKRETEVAYTVSEFMRRYRGVAGLGHLLKVDKKTYYNHDYYHLIHRPINGHYSCYVVLYEGDCPKGFIALYRAVTDPDFSEDEHAKLERLAPYITHGLTPAKGLQTEWVDGEEAGLIIMDRRGRLVHLSERGRKLLYLASYPKISSLTVNSKHQDFATPTRLAQLCNSLIAVFEGRSSALPPVWHHQNSWGRFCFRAYWLDKTDPSNPSTIGITVTHQIPLPVKLVQLQEQLSLSQQQLELCLLLVTGLSYPKIGKQLGQTEISVVSQSKRIYHTHGTRTREDFITKLRSL